MKRKGTWLCPLWKIYCDVPACSQLSVHHKECKERTKHLNATKKL